MCGRSMYCNTCKLALVIRLCRITSSLLPWLGSHDLSSATVQRSSGAAAMGYLQKMKRVRMQCCCLKVENRKAVRVGKPQTAFLLLRACWLADEEHQRRFAAIKPPMNRLSVGNVGNHAKRERCAADEDFIGIHAINILARDHRPLDLVIVATAADKRNV